MLEKVSITINNDKFNKVIIISDTKDIVCDFSNLYKAMKECRKGVMWKDSVARYSNNGLVSILQLRDSLLGGTYKINDYHQFTIHEPKKRDIVSTGFKDRVFQRSLCDNYLYNEITKSFVYDNGACQIGRGTDFTKDRLTCHLQRYYRQQGQDGYVLNCDFKNFFGSTPHYVAKDAMAKLVKDKWALGHVYDIIDSYDQGNQTGLGLGSQVTQLIQLAVLNNLDHMIKENLKIKGYVRYMDDLILIHHDKEYLKHCLGEINKRVVGMELTLNVKKTQIHKLEQGINFLGFKFILTDTGKVLKLISKENIKKRKRKLRKYKKLVSEGRMTREKADECYIAWKAHAEKGDSYLLLQRMDKYYNDLWKE